jgi:hypothetical protein
VPDVVTIIMPRGFTAWNDQRRRAAKNNLNPGLMTEAMRSMSTIVEQAAEDGEYARSPVEGQMRAASSPPESARIDVPYKVSVGAQSQAPSYADAQRQGDVHGGAMAVLCDGLERTRILDSMDEFLTRYAVGDEIGRGAFSVVHAVTRTGHGSHGNTAFSQPLAVKIIRKEGLGGSLRALDPSVRRMRDECRVLAELRHPHIIQLIEICESPSLLCILMERVPTAHTAPPLATASGTTLLYTAPALSTACGTALLSLRRMPCVCCRSVRRAAPSLSASCRPPPSQRATRCT